MSKKIILLSAPSEDAETIYKGRTHELNIFGKANRLNAEFYSLGICYLGAVLEKNNHLVTLFDFFSIPLNLIEKTFFDKILEITPHIIGFSMLTMNRTSSFHLINKIKKNFPNIKIIVGGVHCSTLYEQILLNYPVDVVCTGEGEAIINDIVENIDNIDKLKKIKGIAIKFNNRIIKNAPTELITDLDSLPFPKHDSFLNENSNVAYISTSRGCVGDCTFCSTRQYWGCNWRARNPKKVVDEIEYLIGKFPKLKYIWFYDDTFTLNNKRVIEFCDELIKRRIKINWICGGRVHPISFEMLQSMKKAGCKVIMYGIESGSEKILRSMKKFITRKQIIHAFTLTRNAGINAGACLLVGLPGENDITVNETIDLLKKINYAAPSVGILELYPNTQIYKIAVNKRFINDDYWLSDKKVPKYTSDLSINKLKSMAFKIVFQSHKNKGYLCLSRFVIMKIVKNPKQTVNNTISYFKSLVSLK